MSAAKYVMHNCAKCGKVIKTARILHMKIAMPATYFHPNCYKKMQKIHGLAEFPVQQ